MIEIIKNYQKQYISILEDFDCKKSSYDDYILLIDRVELILKRSKKTIINYLELNRNYVYYGGSVYFTKKRKETYALLFSNKCSIVADPLLKMKCFVINKKIFSFERIKEIVDNAITNTLEISEELLTGNIVYINPDDFIKEIKDSILNTSKDLTLQFLNLKLKTNYMGIAELIEDNKKYNFNELEVIYPKLNQNIITVGYDEYTVLEHKITNNYKECGIDENLIKNQTAIEQVVETLIGLFAQAFELKSVSLILKCPLYIVRSNVLFYLNSINNISKEDKLNIRETNILYGIYRNLRQHNLKNEELKRHFKYGYYYNQILSEINNKFSFTQMFEYIDEFIKENSIISDSIIEKEDN